MTKITCNGAGGLPDPELVERPVRRWASAEYKLRIMREADRCSTSSEVGALLRREGLYMSHLVYWRTQHETGALAALGQPHGSKPTNGYDAEIADLRRRLERAEAELEKARKVIAVQGNLSALLEHLLEPGGSLELGRTGR
jgi:transposase